MAHVVESGRGFVRKSHWTKHVGVDVFRHRHVKMAANHLLEGKKTKGYKETHVKMSQLIKLNQIKSWTSDKSPPNPLNSPHLPWQVIWCSHPPVALSTGIIPSNCENHETDVYHDHVPYKVPWISQLRGVLNHLESYHDQSSFLRRVPT